MSEVLSVANLDRQHAGHAYSPQDMQQQCVWTKATCDSTPELQACKSHSEQNEEPCVDATLSLFVCGILLRDNVRIDFICHWCV